MEKPGKERGEIRRTGGRGEIMGYSIGLSPNKKIMPFGLFKFNPDAGEAKHFRQETKVDMTKKEVKWMIKDLKAWGRIMEDSRP